MKIPCSRIITIAFVSTVLYGCGENESEPLMIDMGLETTDPEYVYVPTENVVSKVVVKASSVANVGDWVELNATRDTSGKWLKVKASGGIRLEFRILPTRNRRLHTGSR